MNRPCKNKSIAAIIREAEILLSRNMSFELGVHENRQFIRSDGVAKWLPTEVKWQPQVLMDQTGIPYVASQDNKQTAFCISFFQAPEEQEIHSIPELPGRALLSRSSSSAAPPTAGAAPMTGQISSTEVPTVALPESQGVLVCHCGEERAECEKCGRGYMQEVRKGRVPKALSGQIRIVLCAWVLLVALLAFPLMHRQGKWNAGAAATRIARTDGRPFFNKHEVSAWPSVAARSFATAEGRAGGWQEGSSSY